MTPQWQPTWRQWVIVAFVALFLLGIRIVWPFLTPLALALLLSYILIPVVDRVERATRWNRTGAAAFVYLVLIILLALVPALVTPVIVSQVQSLVPTMTRGAEELGGIVADLEPRTIFGQEVDPYDLYLQLSNSLVSVGTRIASSSLNLVFGVAARFVTTVLWLLFILVISFYIVRDSPNISRYLWSLVPRDARVEAYYLVWRIDRTWNAFLRGQLLLSSVVCVLTMGTLMLLGVPQAVFLGVLAGVLNLVPNLGPIFSSVPAIAIALIQGSTHWNLSNLVFAVIVGVAYILIQQMEGNVLVPRIIGRSVRLHPVVVIVGAIVGLSVVGLLGIFLAAPTLASLRVIGGYAYRKLLDPTFQPSVTLPPAIAAIPDPRERPSVPIPSPTDPKPPALWQHWLARLRERAAPPPPPPSEEIPPDVGPHPH